MLISCLKGGLGNQMFQYAAARAFSLKCNVNMYVDNWSGFVRDYEFNRKYELSRFPIAANIAPVSYRIPIWIHRLLNRDSSGKPLLCQNKWYGCFINEGAREYSDEMLTLQLHKLTYMNGYWQSPLYFGKYAEIIKNELMPPIPKSKKILDMAESILSVESVAVGVRQYEECSMASNKSMHGRITPIDKILKVVEQIKIERPYSKVFLFSTLKSDFLRASGFHGDVTILNSENGFNDPVECLWLLTRCRHHVISNSTFYWWGAWLSQSRQKSNDQKIIAANNFSNKNTIPVDWDIF
jgi:hypothetical protein